MSSGLSSVEGQRPFDLTKGPLLRIVLVRLGQQEHIFLLTMHHIVCDDWSMGILMREVSQLYKAFCTGYPSPFDELPLQYADFAYWQRQWLSGEMLEQQLSYWKRQLDDIPVLPMFNDRPRPTVQTFCGTHKSLLVPKSLAVQLEGLGGHAGCTLFMTLLTSFQTLLYFDTERTDIIVGTDVANRNRPEIEPIIGFFVNQLVLRLDMSGNPSFQELLLQGRKVALDAYTYQDLPFEKVVNALKMEGEMGHHPIFQVKFVLQNVPKAPLQLPNLTLTFLATENRTAKFDLLLNIWDNKEGLIGELEYNTDLFESSTISRMLERFLTILRAVVINPTIRLHTLKESLMQVEEQQQIRKEKVVKETRFQKLKASQRKPIDILQ